MGDRRVDRNDDGRPRGVAIVDRHVPERPHAMGGGEENARAQHQGRAEAGAVAAADQHHRHPVGEAAVGRSPDQRPRWSERRGERRDKRQRSDRAGQRRRHRAASCARTRRASIVFRPIIPLSPLSARRPPSARVPTIHIAFSRQGGHGPAAFRQQRLSSSWPRSPWFAASRPGAPSWRAPRPTRSRLEPPRAAAGEAGLPQRSRDARRGQVPPSDRAVRGAQIRRGATQGRGAVGETLSYRRRFHL